MLLGARVVSGWIMRRGRQSGVLALLRDEDDSGVFALLRDEDDSGLFGTDVCYVQEVRLPAKIVPVPSWEVNFTSREGIERFFR